MNLRHLSIAILAFSTLHLTMRGQEASSPSATAAPTPGTTPAVLTLEHAKTLKHDLRIIDSCVDQYAIENNSRTGTRLTPAQVALYLKPSSFLYKSMNDSSGPKDRLGNPFGTFTVDILPTVPAQTAKALADIAPADFWSPFPIGK